MKRLANVRRVGDRLTLEIERSDGVGLVDFELVNRKAVENAILYLLLLKNIDGYQLCSLDGLDDFRWMASWYTDGDDELDQLALLALDHVDVGFTAQCLYGSVIQAHTLPRPLGWIKWMRVVRETGYVWLEVGWGWVDLPWITVQDALARAPVLGTAVVPRRPFVDWIPEYLLGGVDGLVGL